MTAVAIASGHDKVRFTMQQVFTVAKLYIEQLECGQKITQKELQEKVAAFLDLPQALVTQFIAAFVQTYDNCTVQRGRNGGIYKGKFQKKKEAVRCNCCGQKLMSKKT